MSEQPSPSEDHGRVIRFRPRKARRSSWQWSEPRPSASETPVADLTKYQRTKGGDDYRHRMMMNGLGLAVATVLIVVGVWLAARIAELSRAQDCYLQGGRDCSLLVIPQPER